MLIPQGERLNCSKGLSLPDLVSLASPEPELPTLHLDLGPDPLQDGPQLNAPVATIHLDPLQAGTVGHYRVHTPFSDYLLDTMNGYPAYGQETVYTPNLTMAQMERKPSMPAGQPASVTILEQPKSNSLRFRYQCEGRGAGALQGAGSTPELRTFPKIQIQGYSGPAVVVVSCVGHEGDRPKAHPHNLVSPAAVGREGCKKGVCTMNVPRQTGPDGRPGPEDMTVEFQHLGIQCVRRRDVSEALRQRSDIRVDPFRQGFEHSNSPQSVDLNAVRLCFQVFLESPTTPGKFTVPVPAVCSTPIFDAKAKKTLQIMDISDTHAPMEGGKKIIILCERVARDDIKVRFFDPMGSWEGWGDFTAQDVHKQYAITFTSPSYTTKDGMPEEKKTVLIELQKPSDDSTSEPMEFTFLPKGHVTSSPVDKRPDIKKQHQTYNTMGSMWPVKKEKEDTSNGWGIPPMAYCHPEVQQPSQPYIPNIPNPYPAYVQTHHMPAHAPDTSLTKDFEQMAHANNMYGVPQPSPDSEGFAEMKIRSPPHDPQTIKDDVEQLSGHIESFHLEPSLAPSLSDCVSISLDMQQQHMFTAGEPADGKRQSAKRGAKSAALESGSIVVPPVQGRYVNDPELNTPNNSTQLSGSYNLNNCSRVNDL